ncbi:hypothetical protein VCHENC02_2872B, partial [Vibrio harveyi]
FAMVTSCSNTPSEKDKK